MALEKTTEYLIFRYIDASPSGKTEVWAILSASSGDRLGTIKWFGRWRQYAFFPEPNTVFNVGCLNDITEHIDELMARRRG